MIDRGVTCPLHRASPRSVAPALVRGRQLLRVGLFAALLSGCDSGEARFAPARPDRGDDSGAGRADASEQKDAAPVAGDSGTDEDDASVVRDAGQACGASAEERSFAAEVPFSDEGGYSLTTGLAGFGLAYQAPEAGCNTIWTVPVHALGMIGDPSSVLDDCKTISDLALLRTDSGWRMVWVDNADDTAELQTSLLGDDMATPAGALRTRLTHNQLREERPVLADFSGTAFVAFIATDRVTRSASILGQRLAGSSKLLEIIPESAGRKPTRLALTQIGKSHALLAFIDEHPDTRGIWLQRIDLEGAPTEDPVKLSDFAGPGSTIDFATRALGEGGAVLYSATVGGENNEVRFRRLNATGGLLGSEVKVVGAPLQARDGSITRVGGGYVVGYRALPGGLVAEPQIRMTVITKEGRISRDATGALLSYPIAESSPDGGRVSVRLSNDGVLLFGFVDATEQSTQLRLVRKRIECPPVID